jgi:PBP1b-binding outer membrane lipoprotein LpoB
MKANKTTRGQAVSNHRRRKDKESECNTDSVAHNQTIKQQKQLNDRNYHILININTGHQQTQLPHQKTQYGKLN